MMVTGVVQIDMDSLLCGMRCFYRLEQGNQAHCVNLCHLQHLCLAGLKVDGTMNVQALAPGRLFDRDRSILRRPTSRGPAATGNFICKLANIDSKSAAAQSGRASCGSGLSALPPRRRLSDRSIGLFMQNPLRGAFEIVVLPVFERPHEGRECGNADAERNRYQVKVVLHSAASITAVAENRASPTARSAILGRLLRRSALATTKMDDPDIATAATSGVT